LALVDLDDSSVGTLLFSRPFVVGPLVGGVLGDPFLGAGLGVAVEAITLEKLPLGGNLGLSAPVAAWVAVFLAAGPARLPAEVAFPAGLAAGFAHARVELFLRRRRGGHIRRVEAAIAQGLSPGIGLELSSSLALQAAATFVVALTALLALGPALAFLWPLVPQFVQGGARIALSSAPWLGAGGLAASLWRRA